MTNPYVVAVVKAFAKLSIHRAYLQSRFPDGPVTLEEARQIIACLEFSRDSALDELEKALK